MQSFVSIRLAAASFVFSALLSAQSSPAPHAKPTAIVSSTSGLPVPPPATPAPPSTPSQLPPRSAQISYTNGTLSISADNSSLDQILRDISHDTGITISGGVPDERVFGKYGPDAPDQVLAALLDGTGSNVLFVHRNGDAPPELILTARQGGPTPPNPAAAAAAAAAAVAAENKNASPSTPVKRVESEPGERNRPPRESSNAPATSAPSGSESSQPQSPNGVKTPQQIYDQLQRLHQQPPQTPQ